MHNVNHVEDAHGSNGKSDRSQSINYAFSIQPSDGKTIDCVVGGVNLPLLVDTGASVNVVDTPTWFSFKEKGIECKSWKCQDQIFFYGHQTGLSVIGKVSAQVSPMEKCVEAEFLVFEGTGVPILSLETAKDLEVLKIVHAVTTGQEVKEKYRELFEGIGKLKDITLDLHIDDSKPRRSKVTTSPASSEREDRSDTGEPGGF